MSRRKKSKAVPFNPADIASIKDNPYVQRLVEDSSLRDQLKAAVDASKNVYERVSDAKTPAKTLLEDKKVQGDLRRAVEAIRDVTTALTEAPQRQAKKGLRLGRGFVVLGVGGAAALVGSEKLRSKVLDVLFGAEEEFEYTPPATAPPATGTAPTQQAPAGAA
jgi:glutamine synthetase adenylyltransferase